MTGDVRIIIHRSTLVSMLVAVGCASMSFGFALAVFLVTRG